MIKWQQICVDKEMNLCNAINAIYLHVAGSVVTSVGSPRIRLVSHRLRRLAPAGLDFDGSAPTSLWSVKEKNYDLDPQNNPRHLQMETINAEHDIGLWIENRSCQTIQFNFESEFHLNRWASFADV